jgi:hypothetical protein
MVPGFNTDFRYRGETYHVQTEDNGVGNPVVVTLLYHKGAILASRRTPYGDLAGKPGFERELLGLMKSQHKDVMRALLVGAYDRDGAAPSAPSAAGDRGGHPAAAAVSAPALRPQGEQAPAATMRVAPAAPPPPAAVSLDKAIRRYLEGFAAAAAQSR